MFPDPPRGQFPGHFFLQLIEGFVAVCARSATTICSRERARHKDDGMLIVTNVPEQSKIVKGFDQVDRPGLRRFLATIGTKKKREEKVSMR